MKSRMYGNETHPIWIQFRTMLGIPEIVTCANFGDDQLVHLGVAGSQILSFPTCFRRPYNSLAQPSDKH